MSPFQTSCHLMLYDNALDSPKQLTSSKLGLPQVTCALVNVMSSWAMTLMIVFVTAFWVHRKLSYEWGVEKC